MSKARQSTVLLLVFAAFLAAPAANAQCGDCENPDVSTPTTLYFHVFDTFNRFVINTEPMDSTFFQLGGSNFNSVPGTGVSGSDQYTGLGVEDGYDLNQVYGYSTAGPVEYDFIENGRPRYHPERGIAADVQIDDSVTPLVYVYLDVRDALGTNDMASALPQFTVTLTVQEGDDPGRDANLDEGKDIMSGSARFQIIEADVGAPTTAVNYGYCFVFVCNPPPAPSMEVAPGNDVVGPAVAGQDFGGSQAVVPDENGIVEIVVPLEVHSKIIPKKEAYNVRIGWHQNVDPSGSESVFADDFSTGFFRLASDPDHLTRMELNIMNPVYFSFIHPQVAGGSLLIHAGGNSPWGTYDVDLTKVGIEMTHVATGDKVPDNQLKKILNSNEHVHGLHDEDAQITYLWDFREHGADLGEYTIDMSLTNDANDGDGDYADSATAFATAKFVVDETEAYGIDTTGQVVEASELDSGEVETPGVGILATVALLGSALLLTRRLQA